VSTLESNVMDPARRFHPDPRPSIEWCTWWSPWWFPRPEPSAAVLNPDPLPRNATSARRRSAIAAATRELVTRGLNREDPAARPSIDAPARSPSTSVTRVSNGAVSAWLDADIGTANEPSALVRIRHGTERGVVRHHGHSASTHLDIHRNRNWRWQRVPAVFAKVNFGEGETARAALQAQGARTAP
jgi:hypothetical protein